MVGWSEEAEKILENYPELEKLNEKAREQEGVKKYIENRPSQEY